MASTRRHLNPTGWTATWLGNVIDLIVTFVALSYFMAKGSIMYQYLDALNLLSVGGFMPITIEQNIVGTMRL